MNQQEKIKAYLLNQLGTDETMAFKEEIQNDPELKAVVTSAKLLLIAQELKHRKKLKEQMNEWKEENLGPEVRQLPWMKQYKYWIIIAFLFISLAIIGIYTWQGRSEMSDKNNVSQGDSAVISAPSILLPTIDTANSFKNIASENFSTTKKLDKFSNAILMLEIKTENKVVMKGNNLGVPASAPKNINGFIMAKNSKYYVITNAYAVKNAGYGVGDVIGTDQAGQKYTLKLIGTDNFYDIAVLSIIDKSGDDLQAVRMSDNKSEIEEPVYLFSTVSSFSVKRSLYSGRIQRNYGNFLKIGVNTSKISATPVIDSDGSVVGVFSEYAKSLFPEENFRKYILSANLASKIIEEILLQKGNPKRCYSGIGFSTNKSGKVIINHIIEDSPASINTDLIDQEVNTINNTKISSLSDVSEALRKTKPGESFLLTSTGGVERNIQTREMTNPRLERIAAKAIDVSGEYSYETSPGNPVIRYINHSLPSTDFIISECQVGESGEWHIVMVTADFGEILRHVALAGKGAVNTFENNNTSKKTTLKIQYQNPILWN